MKIEGHRPYFDTGPGVSPMGQQQAQSQATQRIPDAVTKVAKVSGAVGSNARQSGDAAPTTALKQQADAASRSTDVTSAQSARDPLDDANARNSPDFREPSLPRLSAEALATALMNSEPDKAVVPRVLPVDMATANEV